MSAGIDEFLGNTQVVVEGVQIFAGVRHIAGVTQRAFGDCADLDGGFDGRAHLFDVVERVEHPEDVDTGAVRFGHEGAGNHIGIRRITHRVAAANEHLKAQVWCGLA